MSTRSVEKHPILLTFRLAGSEPAHFTAIGEIVRREEERRPGLGGTLSSEVTIEISRSDLGPLIATLHCLRIPSEPPDMIDRLRSLAEAAEASDDESLEAFVRQLRTVVGSPNAVGMLDSEEKRPS